MFGLFVTNVTVIVELLQQLACNVNVILPLTVIILVTVTGTA